MDNIQDDPKEKIKIDSSTEYNGDKVIVKGTLKNEGYDAVIILELKCLYKNFDGFVMDVDTMAFDYVLSPGDTFPFKFPERNSLVNCYTCEVVVSKSRVK